MNDHVNERLLQRCVDGEMSETEQQEFLRSLEHSPTGWRDLALAYVEQQLWSQAGRAWVDEPEPTAAPDSVPLPNRAASWLRSTVLVASSLLAVGLGYLGGTYWRPDSVGSPNLAGTSRANSSELAVSIPERTQHSLGKIGSSVVQVEMPGPAGEAVTLPVYDVEDLVPNWSDPEVRNYQQNLRDQGMRFDSRPNFYTVPVDDRHQLVFPFQKARQTYQ